MARAADIAGAGKQMKKAHPPLRRERPRKHEPLPHAGGVRVGRSICRAFRKPARTLIALWPSSRREGSEGIHIIGQADIPLDRNPAATETAGVVLRHGCDSRGNKKGSHCGMGGGL
ncbi:hypothetical protein NSE01_08700 [Novosphingobium sediminis]|uniref:Uncharacterized protein n=1 Tax=Novosphingobium sediminis TaxID=707214 RepID=A0A512AH49_9SPHN|nr:hypothetical protein NSE01_08700 [Novosphingobium sediminis]